MFDAAAPHGLMPVAGSTSHVGAVGYLLGGGLGAIVRSHGFSSDYVESFTVVTAAGEVVEASATKNPDLFWGLCGGKAGFGVVIEARCARSKCRPFTAGCWCSRTPHRAGLSRLARLDEDGPPPCHNQHRDHRLP